MEDVQTPMSQLLIRMDFGKELVLETQPNCRIVLDKFLHLLELKFSMSGCQAHIIALGLIRTYQSTDLNVDKRKGFWILNTSSKCSDFWNRLTNGLSLYSQWANYRLKNAWTISMKLRPSKLLSWHHLCRRSSGSVAACPLTLPYARAWHMRQPI